MTLYADTSFLVSFLYRADAGHAAARAFFRQHAKDEWLTSSWSQFETVNSLRQLCRHRPAPRPQVPEALRRLFKHWHDRGAFSLREADLEEAVRECEQISAAHGTRLAMRAADVLHVALLEQINPDLFVTRDREQHDLAMARAFQSHLVA